MIVVFDLDGTLSIVGDRLKYLDKSPKDWKSFFNACDEDKVNLEIARLYRLFSNHFWVKVVTGRSETTREKTMKWFGDNGLFVRNSNLHMRADGDYRHDTLVKPELVAEFINRIQWVFEDRNSMVQKWRELGLTCLQVADGDF